MTSISRGGCLCGGVRYQVIGAPPALPQYPRSSREM